MYLKAVELDPANEGYHVSLEDVEVGVWPKVFWGGEGERASLPRNLTDRCVWQERLRAQGSSQPRQAQPDLAGILGSITSDPQLMGMVCG